jgi:hypothetical protein
MTTRDRDGDPNGAANEETAALREGIERTREEMTRTVNAIEERLSPARLKEQVADVKASILGEYHDAKDHLKEDIGRELREAKEKAERELSEAKLKLQAEIHQARTAVREATVGRVEHIPSGVAIRFQSITELLGFLERASPGSSY